MSAEKEARRNYSKPMVEQKQKTQWYPRLYIKHKVRAAYCWKNLKPGTTRVKTETIIPKPSSSDIVAQSPHQTRLPTSRCKFYLLSVYCLLHTAYGSQQNITTHT